MRQLFEEQLAAGEVARLLDLAPLARDLLPSFLREKAASTGAVASEDFSIPGAQGVQRVGADGVGEDGLPVYDSWLAQLLRPFPHFAWLHSISMQQYGDAHKLLVREAHAEKQSLQQKKLLLSLSKLALLADSGEGEVAVMRANSDASMATETTASASESINTNELQVIDDQLFVLLAQEFLASLYAPEEGEEEAGKQAVLPPAELITRLTQAGLDAVSRHRQLIACGCSHGCSCVSHDFVSHAIPPPSVPLLVFSSAAQLEWCSSSLVHVGVHERGEVLPPQESFDAAGQLLARESGGHAAHMEGGRRGG